MASSTPNLGLTLPVGGEHVSRQIINANNVKIDEAVGPVPSGTDLQSQVTALKNNIAKLENYTQITGNTKSAIESALLTFAGTMSNGEQRLIWFANGTASEPMQGTTYIGSIGKQENRLIVQVRGISNAEMDLTGFYKSNTGWDWQSLNSELTNHFANNNDGLCVLKFESHAHDDAPSTYSDGITFMNTGGTTTFPLNYSLVITFRLSYINRIAQIIVKYTGEAKIRSADGNSWGEWKTLS